MGTRKFESKHGVGILLNKKRRKRINWIGYINERAIATSITFNNQRVLLMSVSPTRDTRTTTSKEHTEQSRKHEIPKEHQNRGRGFQRRIGAWDWC